MTTTEQHRKWRRTPRGRELWKAARARYRRAHYRLVLASNRRLKRRRRGWPEWAVGLPRTATLLQVMAAWRRWQSTVVDAVAQDAQGRAGGAGRVQARPGP